MLFKRRERQKIHHKIKESVWPTMGWNRTVAYLRHRVFRRAQSPYQVTAGLAIGMAISFTPLLGTHLFQALFFAWLFRVNMIAAAVGTAFGNPWTFPILFWIAYQGGFFVFNFFGAAGHMTLPDPLTWSYLLDNPLDLFLPMLVGGYLCSAIFTPLLYILLYYPIKGMQRAYHAQRQSRIDTRK
jgi:uncharacterized protein (DUF2062 family)